MDRIAESLKNGRIVFWEEIARDGAQAKTILTAMQRIEIANAHSKVFNEHGPDHLVFAAGFISICKEEVRAIRELADKVDNCYLAVNCRSVKNEIDLCFDSIKQAKFGRIACVFPASERLCRLMLHKSQKEALETAVDMAKYALDTSNGIPVDFQLAGAFDADPQFISEIASALTNQGIATVGMGDTRGIIYPNETDKFIKKVKKLSNPDILFGLHFHNDMGFALMNNLESIKQGITFPSSSWIGLAERNGLVRTELLLLLLAFEPEKLKDRLGIDGEKLFLSKPNLKMLPKIAKMVSEYTGIPLKVTDPVIGTGVNTISTGTPFVDTQSFQPFDPQEVLGINQTIFVTQLASIRVIREVSNKMGFELNESQIHKVLDHVKSNAYEFSRSIVPEDELKEIFKKVIENFKL